MTGYRGTDGDTSPVPFEYDLTPDGLLPDWTRDGQKIWINTHFPREEDAWKSILGSVDAGLRLCAGQVKRAEKQLQDAYEAAAKMTVEYKTAHDNYDQWLRNGGTKGGAPC